jgi:hypothetical protein
VAPTSGVTLTAYRDSALTKIIAVADPTQTLTSGSFTYSLPATSVTSLVFNLPTSRALARDAVREMLGRPSWSAGLLTVPGTTDERIQIIDVRGNSRVVELANGQARTGQLPAGLYQARLLEEPNSAPQRFLVFR